MAFDRIQLPHDPYWIGAMQACVTANANRAKGRPAKVEDFLPKLSRKRTQEEIDERNKTIMRQLKAMQDARMAAGKG